MSNKKKLSKKKRIVLIAIGSLTLVSITLAIIFSSLYMNGLLSVEHALKNPKDGQIRVACVGDSITYGAGVEHWTQNAYPFLLGDMLGDDYCVNNYGYSGRTGMFVSNAPYVNESIYGKSLDFNPDIVVIMFGTNDSKPYNWRGEAAFISDYFTLISSYADLPSAPEIYVIAPPPCFEIGGEVVLYNIDMHVVANQVVPAVKKVAEQGGWHFIDMYSVFENRSDLLLDGVHPNVKGTKVFAGVVYEAMMGKGSVEGS